MNSFEYLAKVTELLEIMEEAHDISLELGGEVFAKVSDALKEVESTLKEVQEDLE